MQQSTQAAMNQEARRYLKRQQSERRSRRMRAVKRALKRYGTEACRAAYLMSEQGFGASGVAHEGPVSIKTTQQADAAINAGRWLSERGEAL